MPKRGTAMAGGAVAVEEVEEVTPRVVEAADDSSQAWRLGMVEDGVERTRGLEVMIEAGKKW
jgi:hypothetical protein